MYFENNRRMSSQRTNDDFLRRMLGGELTQKKNIACDQEKKCGRATAPMPRREMQGMSPTPTVPNACPLNPQAACTCNCPTQIPAPSVAMVYVPRQCWKGLMDPATGLSYGTIFTDLVLPLTGKCKNPEKEVKPCRLM